MGMGMRMDDDEKDGDEVRWGGEEERRRSTYGDEREREVQGWEMQEKGKGKKLKMKTKNSIWARAKLGFLITTSFRFTGTPYEVKNVPHFSSRDPSYIPSRREFLRQKAITALTCYLILNLFSLFSSDPATNAAAAAAANYSPAMIPIFARLSQVSSQELIKRLITTLGAGFGAYCFQLGVHSFVAFLDVGLGMSEVRYWRPLFGSLKEAYTVRRFWG